MKVLVIEDDSGLMQQLCGLLTDLGYTTLQAKDEQEAEQVLVEHGDDISVAIIDMKLPSKLRSLEDSESGLRIVQLLASTRPDIILIVHTGFETFDDAMKSVEAGASYYIVKGDEPDLVLKIVARATETWKKRKMIEDATIRIGDNLPLLVANLEKMDASIKTIGSLCVRIRDEMQCIEMNTKPVSLECGKETF